LRAQRTTGAPRGTPEGCHGDRPALPLAAVPEQQAWRPQPAATADVAGSQAASTTAAAAAAAVTTAAASVNHWQPLRWRWAKRDPLRPLRLSLHYLHVRLRRRAPVPLWAKRGEARVAQVDGDEARGPGRGGRRVQKQRPPARPEQRAPAARPQHAPQRQRLAVRPPRKLHHRRT